jgi:monoamine oxidase
MTRREFLTASVALPLVGRLQQPWLAPRARVIVLGAGLAGLAAAHDLVINGYDVVVVEARQRPGGRVHTLREPFSDSLYAEAGAARIQDSHAFTLRYVEQFGLTLEPFFPSGGARVNLVRGQRISGALDLATLPLTFSDEERRLGFGGSMAHYLFRHLAELGDVAAPGWPDRDVSRFETSIDEFCRAQGATAGIRRLIALGHDLTGMSALQFLRDAALGAATKTWFKIRGGNDRLPRAFAEALAGRIHYGTPVARIAQDDRGITVTVMRGGRPETIRGDYGVAHAEFSAPPRADTWRSGSPQ